MAARKKKSGKKTVCKVKGKRKSPKRNATAAKKAKKWGGGAY